MQPKSFLIALLSCCFYGISAQNPTVSATKVGNRIDITIGNQFFTSYHFQPDEKYPFFFPVNGPVSGGSVTSLRNGEYPHHSSLFFGCDLVNGGNYWQEGLERGRIISIGARILEGRGERIVIADECIWKRPDAESPIIDRRLITVTAPSKDIYQIDFDIEMEMLTDVTILKTNHSLFSARIDPDLSVKQGGVMINAEGKETEKGTFGAPSPWIDCYGARKTGTEGIAIMQHPSNKWYPSPWFTRDYGFISPTPMFWPENDKETKMKKGEVIKLRYRVLAHGGTTQQAGIAEAFEKYKNEVRLITLDPGHFHAALVQKTSYPDVSANVFVYAPAGADLEEHLKRIEGYNTRTDEPTKWNEIVYRGADFLEKMLSEKKGNVMVTAGNNGLKTEYIRQTLSAGIHVLADKPMAINTADFEKLKECFEIAQKKGLLLYDVMTERFEITTQLQKAFSLIPAVYGEQQKGTKDDPGIVKESVHHFFKTVSGNPLLRPAWFYDVSQQGEGVVDVTTHLVDLVQWACFPGQIINYQTDIELLDANRWTTAMSADQFKASTGFDTYPDYLKKDVTNDTLYVYSNGNIFYKIRGVNAKVSVIWNYTYPEGGGDTHYSIMKGSKAHLIIQQGKEQNYQPVLYIQAVASNTTAFEKDLLTSMKTITEKYPGIDLKKIEKDKWEVIVPAHYHNGHEAHFGQVTENFLKYLKEGALPAWEVPNMIAKYYITTQALALAKSKAK